MYFTLRSGRAFLLRLVAFTFVLGSPVFAASPYFKDVCASGCTYSSVQAAIDSITDSSATNVYTIFLDSGVLSSNTSITTNGKSYISFVGRGMGVSIVRASATWFQNVFNGTQPSDFFDLAGSTNVTFRGLTIDARTLDPGGLYFSGLNYAGLQVGDADRILIDSTEIQGIIYALWEDTNTSGHLIEVLNSKIRGVNAGVSIRNATWHIFASDIRAVTSGGESGGIVTCNGVQVFGAVNTTIWGSHIHAESGVPGLNYVVAAINSAMSPGGRLNILGSTLHVKMTTGDVGSATRFMVAYYLTSGYQGEGTLIGSELLYETTTSLSQGLVGGIGYASVNPAATINLVGAAFNNKATGGSIRADIIGSPAISQNQPTIRNAGSRISSAVSSNATPLLAGIGGHFDTISTQSGSVTFPGSNTVTVTLPVAMPDTNYRVAVTPNVSETIYVGAKTTTTLTLKSSKTGSTAVVDWTTTR